MNLRSNIKQTSLMSIIIFIIILSLATICLLISMIHGSSKLRQHKYENSIFVNNHISSQYTILVDVEISKLTVFMNGKIYKTYRCAGGKFSTPSPIGTWTIIDKGKWNEGFGGSWLGIDVPWGKFGIHGTIFPESIGHNTSQGCIRMYNKDVSELYKYINHGTKVAIVDGCYGVWGRGFRTLKPGMYGADVMTIQKRLQSMGFFKGYINGKYESSLQDAIHRYQIKNNMPTDNNIYPATIKKLGFVLID